MLEKSIEKYLRDRVKTMGGVALKINSANMAGLPDRMVLFPGGKIYFVELKAPGKKPRPLQLASHRILRDLGFRVFVIDTKEGVLDFLIEVVPNEVHTA